MATVVLGDLISTDTSQGTCVYNDIDFGPAVETLGFTMHPIPSGDGRTSIGNRYTFRIRTILARVSVDTNLADNGTDPDMELVRQRLSSYGGRFTYDQKGAGSFDVNADFGPKSDILWGPQPKELSWKPLGGNLAVELVWQVEFAISDCTLYSPFGRAMEFAWDVTYGQNSNRLTTRTLKGYYRIPGRKLNVDDRQLIDSADNYYEAIVPVIPVGFKRVSENRVLSRDKSMLEFSFTDEQLEYPLPPGCMEANINITSGNAKGQIFTQWMTTISADYKLALGVQPAWSFWLFWQLVQDRINAVRAENQVFGGNAANLAGAAGNAAGDGAINAQDNPGWFKQLMRDAKRAHKCDVLPVSLNYTENPMERRCSYSASFVLMHGLVPVFMPAHLWRPIPWHNHVVWAQSLQNLRATDPRGYTKEVVRANYDVIVDLCDGVPENFVPDPQLNPTAGEPNLQRIMKGGIDPDTSWIEYQNGIAISVDGKVIAHSPLPANKKKQPQPEGDGNSLGTDWANYISQRPWYIPEEVWAARWEKERGDGVKVQRRARPTVEVWLFGRALRANYPINPPQLLEAGGQAAISANRQGQEYFIQQIVANAGYAVFGAMWRQRWLLSDVPISPIYVPPDPNQSLFPFDSPEPGGTYNPPK